MHLTWLWNVFALLNFVKSFLVDETQSLSISVDHTNNEGFGRQEDTELSSYVPLMNSRRIFSSNDEIPGYSSLYYTCITEDQIHYARVSIPSGSRFVAHKHNRSIHVKTHLHLKLRVVSASKNENRFDPTVLIRKNGIPTTEIFDFSSEFQSVLVLTDELLLENDIILYLGLWGGLPSFHNRFFAGEPTLQCVEIETTIAYEEFVNASIAVDAEFDSFGLMSTALLQGTLDEANEVRSVETEVRVFTSGDLVTSVLVESPLCLSGNNSNCTVEGMVIGNTTADVVVVDSVNALKLAYADTASALNSGSSGIKQGLVVQWWESAAIVYPTVGFSLSSDASASVPVPQWGRADLIGRYSLLLNGSAGVSAAFLDSLLVNSSAATSPKLQVVFFAADWRLRRYKDGLGLGLCGGVKYSAVIPTSVLYSSASIGVGGYIYVQFFTERTVKLLVPQSMPMNCTASVNAANCTEGIELENINLVYNISIAGTSGRRHGNRTALNPSDYLLCLSVGGCLPGCNTAALTPGADECPGVYLSTEVSRGSTRVEDGPSVSGYRVVTVTQRTKWTWLIDKPVISTQSLDSAGASELRLLLHLTPVTDSAVSDTSDMFEDIEVFVLDEVVVADKMSLSFVGCPVGSMLEHGDVGASGIVLCNERHGSCRVQYGDVAVSMCVCKYPWEGSTCDDLSMPYAEYVMQILVLVLSNLSMVPVVVLCVYRGCGLGRKDDFTDNSSVLLAIGAVLCLSSTASVLYHLCDTDVICVGGFLFSSWQIFDVLFSIVSMVFVILYYCPLSIEVPGNTASRPSAVDPMRPNPDAVPNYEMVMMSDVGDVSESGSVDGCGGSRGILVSADEGIGTTDVVLGVLAADLRGKSGSCIPETRTRPDSIILSVERGSMLSVSLSLLVLGIVITPVCNDPTSPVNVGLGLVCSFVLCLVTWICYAICICLEICGCGEVGQPLTPNPTWLSLWRTVLGAIFAVVGMGSFIFQSAEGYWLVHSIWHLCMMNAAYFLVSGRDDFVRFIKSGFVRFVVSRRAQRTK